MRAMSVMIALAVALAGCTGGNETADDAMMAEDGMADIAANNTTVVLPPAMLEGLVVSPDGAPVVGADVFIANVDLTEPVNNIANYTEQRDATLTQTDAEGRFSILWDDDYERVAVQADGLMLHYVDNLSVPANATLELGIQLQALPATTVTAHRGGALYAPDNTLAALHKAGLLGVPRAEIDIQWTQDEVFVLWHDGFVEDQAGQRVWQTSSEDMRARDVGADYHESFTNETVPTMAEALEVMALYGTIPVVEIKITDDPRHAQMVEAAIAELVEAGVQDTAVIISFDPSINTQCGAGGMLCGYIEARPEGQRTDPAGAGNDALGPFIVEHHMPFEIATADYVAESQGNGLKVTAWTVNDVDLALQLVNDTSLDAITTDMPWDIMQALAE